jgi:flagellar biosynthesis protein FlhG
MLKRYTVQEVANVTGLEECEIRFFEQVFREFLTFSQLDLDKNEFSRDHVDVLCRIKELIHGKGQSIDEVKRELKGVMNGSGPDHVNSGGTLTPFVQPPPGRGRYARVIAVTSGKGGVGKTSVCVNLALAFAQTGRKVAIFDADLGLANVHILMGVKPRFNLRHVIEDNFKLEDILTEGPEGVKLMSGGQGVREMANLTAEQRRVILRELDRLEREVDILLIDTGAGISENVLRFATFADEVIAVTTPNIAAAADGYSIIKILLETEPNSKIGLVSNMVNNMYHSKNVFNRIDTATRKYLNYPLGDLGYIVDDHHVEAACQQRKPFMLEYPGSEASKCMRSIATTILDTSIFINKKKDSCFSDLMGALKRTMVGV